MVLGNNGINVDIGDIIGIVSIVAADIVAADIVASDIVAITL